VYAILAALGWGLVYALEQRLLTHFSPAILLFVHSLCAVVMMIPFLLIRSNEVSALVRLGGPLWLLIGVSILAAVTNLLIITSIKELNAPTAAIIEVSYPLFVGVASFFLFGFRPTLPLLMGGALVLAGVMVIVLSDS
jgi:drug/metabolite transporter (DMT)-like permease